MKYFIVLSLSIVGSFTLYVKWIELENLKPTLYIDNYSGSAINIYKKKSLWLELENQSSTVTNELKQGTYFLYIKQTQSNLIDTLRIDIKKKKNYVINAFNAMTYFEGDALYQNRMDGINSKSTKETKISKPYFETNAHFILEKPSNQIEIYSRNKAPKSFNTKTTKKYLRRLNQVW